MLGFGLGFRLGLGFMLDFTLGLWSVIKFETVKGVAVEGGRNGGFSEFFWKSDIFLPPCPGQE